MVSDKGLRLWLAALTGLWALTFAAVLALSRPETLQVRRLEVVNAKGNPIAVLGISPNDGGVLLLYDSNGTLRAAIGMTTKGDAAVDLNDGNGTQRVTIQVNADGTVSAKGLRVR